MKCERRGSKMVWWYDSNQLICKNGRTWEGSTRYIEYNNKYSIEIDKKEE